MYNPDKPSEKVGIKMKNYPVAFRCCPDLRANAHRIIHNNLTY